MVELTPSNVSLGRPLLERHCKMKFLLAAMLEVVQWFNPFCHGRPEPKWARNLPDDAGIDHHYEWKRGFNMKTLVGFLGVATLYVVMTLGALACCVGILVLSESTSSAETPAEFAEAAAQRQWASHNAALAKQQQLTHALQQLENAQDEVAMMSWQATAKQYGDELDDLSANKLIDYVTDDNLAKSRYGKSLPELISLWNTTPLPGHGDFFVGLILFKTSVYHEGLPTALGNLVFDGLSDLHQVSALFLSGALQAGAWSLVELDQVHIEVQEWWDEVIHAFQVADHSDKIAVEGALTEKIEGMQATLNKLIEDDRYFLDTAGQPMPGRKAEYVNKLNYGIGLLSEMRTYYDFYGDVNGDGKVDGQDAAEVDEHFGDTVPVGTNGDVNRDGVVDSADWWIVSARQGMTIY